MTEIKRIYKELEQAFEARPAWHGPSLLQLLDDVTADQAAVRPNFGVHSIWELVLHIAVWEDEVRKCLQGEKLRWISDSEDWPFIPDTSEMAWKKTINELKTTHQQLLNTLSQFDGSLLDSYIPSDPAAAEFWAVTSYYSMLIGIIQHDTYHAGQIAILIKSNNR